MRKLLISSLFLPALFLLAGNVHADAIVVGTALADHAGDLVLDIQVDPNADPTFVSDQLKANLELTDGATVKSVAVENGVAHVSAGGATPGATVQAALSNDIALMTGVGPSLAGVETRRRAFWLLGGLGALAIGGDDGGTPPQAPLLEEPPSATPTAVPPPPVLPTPTPPPPVSP